MAGISNQAVRERKPGIVERTIHAAKRLSDLRSRLENINSNLRGQRPSDVPEIAPEPNSLTNHVESVHNLLSNCEHEVQEICEVLGID